MAGANIGFALRLPVQDIVNAYQYIQDNDVARAIWALSSEQLGAAVEAAARPLTLLYERHRDTNIRRALDALTLSVAQGAVVRGRVTRLAPALVLAVSTASSLLPEDATIEDLIDFLFYFGARKLRKSAVDNSRLYTSTREGHETEEMAEKRWFDYSGDQSMRVPNGNWTNFQEFSAKHWPGCSSTATGPNSRAGQKIWLDRFDLKGLIRFNNDSQGTRRVRLVIGLYHANNRRDFAAWNNGFTGDAWRDLTCEIAERYIQNQRVNIHDVGTPSRSSEMRDLDYLNFFTVFHDKTYEGYKASGDLNSKSVPPAEHVPVAVHLDFRGKWPEINYKGSGTRDYSNTLPFILYYYDNDGFSSTALSAPVWHPLTWRARWYNNPVCY